MQFNNFSGEKVVFVNLTDMKFYNGEEGDICLGGGAYVKEKGYGYEIFNFAESNGFYYGYATPDGKLNLKRISSEIEEDKHGHYIDDVLVIFTARYYICGFYRKAKVYAEPINENKSDRFIKTANEFAPYNLVCCIKDGYLIPRKNREFKVKGFGRYPIWYAKGAKAQQEKYEILKYIDNIISSNEIYYRDDEERFYEGEKQKITAEQRNRNAKARQECLKLKGYTCQICNMNFEDTYGEIGKNFIEVHHINPLSQISGDSVETNPQTDLVPVCPNCHSMIHRTRPCYSVEEIRNLFLKFKGN